MNIRIMFWRAYFFFANPLRKAYWRVFQPTTRSAKCVARNGSEYLLVKLAYGPKYWTFPGGGAKRGESFMEAARRELKEETGIMCSDLRMIGEYISTRNNRRDVIQSFVTDAVSRATQRDPLEVQDVGWFSSADLPEPRSDRVDKILDMLRKAKPSS